MDKTKIVLGIGIALAVLTVFTASATADNYFYFEPQHSSADPGEEVIVWVMLNADDAAAAFDVKFYFEPAIGNISSWRNPESIWDWWGGSPWTDETGTFFDAGGMDFGGGATGPIGLANITFTGNNTGVTQLTWDPSATGYSGPGGTPEWSLINGTFRCTETFNTSLPQGWNLISLPLEPLPGNESVDDVLETVYYDSVQRYDGTTFVPVTTMEPGVGYFVHVALPSTWTYNGTPYKQMNIALEYGLNMFGWLNCTRPIAETSLDNSSLVFYITRWNTTAQTYNEVYNPAAPPPFHDFDTMDRGRGYWVSAKTAFTLTENCSA